MKTFDFFKPVLKLVYTITYGKLKIISYLFWGIEVWPRHSYLTSAFIPIKSDLDLSAYVYNLKRLGSYLKFYSLIRKLFPFVGELNIYTPESILYLKENTANGFELERDPFLLRKFNLDINNAKYYSKEMAISYLLMSLFNDFHKLVNNPSLRIKKWQYHIDHVNRAFAKYNISKINLEVNERALLYSILTAITNLSNVKSMEQAQILRAKLRIFSGFLPKSNEVLNFTDYVLPLLKQELSEVYCYFVEYLAEEELVPPSIDSKQIAILLNQMDWVAFRFLKQEFNSEAILLAQKKIKLFIKIIMLLKKLNPDYEISVSLKKMDLVTEILDKRK